MLPYIYILNYKLLEFENAQNMSRIDRTAKDL